jgi:rRNA maturation RNase YbeY
MGNITFTNHSIKSFRFDKLLLKSFLPIIFIEEGYEFSEVSFIFCSDEYLLGLNKEFLNHDTLTDILTFTLSDISLPIISEVYISVERVKDNSRLFNVEFLDELYRVMIHGVLHLCGYSDHTPELKSQMTMKENYYLEKLRST